MKYNVRLNDKLYEVEVEQGEAIMLNVSDAAAIPTAAAGTAASAGTAAAAGPAASAGTAATAGSAAVAVQAAAAPAPAAAAGTTAAAGTAAGGEMISSPLPGVIMDIKVTTGQNVKKGQVLLLIEAMKMENDVLAPRDGVVRQIIASKGAPVETGSPLLTLS